MNRLILIIASRWSRLVLVLFLVLSLQTTVFADLRPFGIAAQVVLLFVVCAGVSFGVSVGAVVGLIAGLMYDFVLTTPIGLGSLALGLTGATAGLLIYFYPNPTWWMQVVAVAAVSALGEIYFPLAQSMVGLDGWLQFRLLKVIAVVVVVNVVLAPGGLFISRWTLSERKNPI